MTHPLPFKKQLAYACGMMGWSIMINLISVILIYFYLPPDTAGLPKLITQVAVLGIFNVVSLITSGGRLIDTIYDPFIAQYSDTSRHPKGRRIPLMKRAILPSLLFCVLVFWPLKQEEAGVNIIWLAIMLVGFYVSTTTYIIPYHALLPELAPGPEDKVRLATWQSAGFVFGIGISSNAFNIAGAFQRSMEISRIASLQYSVLLLALVAAGCMLITALAINEKEYSKGEPKVVPMKKALVQTLKNRNFLLFLVADFSYFIAVTLITSGLMYFVTVLLTGLTEEIGNKLMMLMVAVSFIFYPVVNYLARKIGKKVIVIFSLFLLGLIFLGIYFLGKPNIDHLLQICLLIGFAAIPLASLNILPVAILAEIIEKDKQDTQENKEAIYVAVRYLFVKVAQTLGIGLFAMLLVQGKDRGHDLGIRLNGILGFILCIVAALIFTRFREKKPGGNNHEE